jgi:hypothetical protein
VEIIDLVTDIKAAIDWGSTAALRRDELQGRLRTRLEPDGSAEDTRTGQRTTSVGGVILQAC